LAGLNVLDIINENSAAALYYGIERAYDVNKTETFILYNMGGSSTKVSVMEYSAYTKNITKRKSKTIGQVNVLSHAWDETLGGNAFDAVLVEMTKKTAEEQLGTELGSKERAMARLRKAAEKGKRVLSANKDAVFRITSLWDDQDFKQKITRDEFMEESQALLDRVLPPIDVALERSGKTKDDIIGIVLMGGGSRIPKIQELLYGYLDKELKKDLNTDEAAALGAAFRAANESTQFQVRKIGFVDTSALTVHATHINNFADYEASLEDDSIDLTELFHKSAEIFESGHVLKKRKSVSFKHDKELYVSIAHDENDPLPSGTHHHIDHYNVSGIERAVKEYSEKNVTDTRPNIRLSFLADGSGVVRLAKAMATFQENVEVAVPRTPPKSETDDKKKKKKKGKKDKGEKDDKKEEGEKAEGEKEGEGEKTEGDSSEDSTEKESAPETEEEKKDEEKTEEKTEEGAGEESKGDETVEKTDDAAKNETKPEPPKIEYDYEWKVKKRKVTLKIRSLGSDVRPLTREQKKQSNKVLMELDEADRAIRETAHAFNDLEAYILEHRPMLYEDEDEFVMQVSEEETREELISLLTETEDWLYDEEEPSAGKFKAKLREIQKLVQPIFSRAYELSNRDKAVTWGTDQIAFIRKAIANLTAEMDWVPKEEFEKATNSTNQFEVWLNKKVEEQKEKTLLETPAFSVEQVQRKVDKIVDAVKLISKRPKPPPPPKKEKKKKRKKGKKKDKDAKDGEEKEGDSSESSIEEKEGKKEEKKEEFEKATNSTNQFEVWLNKKVEEQKEKTLLETPAFSVEQVQRKVDKIVDAVKLISKRPKPPPPPKKEKKKKRKKGKKKDKDAKDGEEKEGDSSESSSEEKEGKKEEKKDGDEKESSPEGGETTSDGTETDKEETTSTPDREEL